VSYILDALDKAEQDRQHTRAPNLKTAHTAAIEPNRARMVLWTTVVTSVALILALVLYQSLDSFRPQERDQILVESSVKSDAPPIVTSSVQDGDLAKASLASPDFDAPEQSGQMPDQVQPEVIEPEAVEIVGVQQPVVAAATEILNINDLPPSVQRQIPNLSFSTHIYASDAAWRMVGINGKSRREGDNIDENLVLLEITEQGIVLGFEEHSFAVSVLKNWSSE
jgi:general secretion pathway protein B